MTSLFSRHTQRFVPALVEVIMSYILELEHLSVCTLICDIGNNKLHSVQPTLGCGSLSNRDRRREQLLLCRLRLGHTYTTHRYLLAGEDPPVCISCQENLTVEHILIHCAEYFHVRYQCFDVNNLGELFRTVSPNIIIQFIQRAGLFYFI